jgi:hypothetical protein
MMVKKYAPIDFVKKIKEDLPFFCGNCLKIKTKDSGLQNMVLNEMQIKFHLFIQEKRRQGYYKFVVLKARQLGISTYTQARFFNKTAYNMAKNTLILSHSLESSQNIFDMVRRFYNNIPSHMPKPSLQNNNRKALIFDEIDGSYNIGTANSKESGRGSTINYFHGSEAAFWREADELMKSVFQTVPADQSSEIILESTANGIGNYFYNLCMMGLDKKSEFQTFFLPWHSNPQYSKPIAEPKFELTDEEAESKAMFNLTNEQINWRRSKINFDFLGNVNNFKQEYPATIQEAFVTSEAGLIPVEKIRLARLNYKIGKYKSEEKNSLMPKIIGIDPAEKIDRTVVAIRRGRSLIKVLEYYKTDAVFLINLVRDLLNNEEPDYIFIDYAYGYSVYDYYKYTPVIKRLRTAHFNEHVNQYYKSVYTNKRSEIHGKMRDWFMQEGGASIPDNDRLEVEIASLPDFKRNANGQRFMILKDEIKKILGGKSPDITDAIALTFTEDVKPRSLENESRKEIRTVNNTLKEFRV